MRSRQLPDAPDFAKGFIGIVFRAKPDGSEFESYYVRPANGNHADPVRRVHGSQYFSYPGYTFAYFREFGIEGYEAPVNIQLDEWITLKAVIIDKKASFFVNDMEHPILRVEDLKHGPMHTEQSASMSIRERKRFSRIGRSHVFRVLGIEFFGCLFIRRGNRNGFVADR